jgi:hypothetical protein
MQVIIPLRAYQRSSDRKQELPMLPFPKYEGMLTIPEIYSLSRILE